MFTDIEKYVLSLHEFMVFRIRHATTGDTQTKKPTAVVKDFNECAGEELLHW